MRGDAPPRTSLSESGTAGGRGADGGEGASVESGLSGRGAPWLPAAKKQGVTDYVPAFTNTHN